MKSEPKVIKSTKAKQVIKSQSFEQKTDDIDKAKPSSARHSVVSGNSLQNSRKKAKQKKKKSVSSQGDSKLSASDDAIVMDCASEGNRSIEAQQVTEMSAQ
jgi:hypothetical protein